MMLYRTVRTYCAVFALLLVAIVSPALGQTPAAEGSGASGQRLKLGKLAVDKILFLGNSITLHGPAAGVWDGNWGMAAGSVDKDYVHLLTAKIAKAVGGEPKILIKNIAEFERKHDTYDLAGGLSQEFGFGPDLVIVAIGENVPGLASDADKAKFAAAFARLLAEIKQHGQPTLVVRSSFWADPAKDQIMAQACQAAGGVFVDIRALGKDEANYARAERKFENAGVANHPGDRGMQAIADAIWLTIEQRSLAN